MYSLLTPYSFLCLLLFFFLKSQPHLASSSSSFSSSSGTHLCSQHESAALIHFKTSFSIDADISGYCDHVGIKSYPKTYSWKEGTDCCSWDGVTCDHVKGHVIGLDLSCSWLYGSFPSNSSLFLLPHLQKLNLSFNYFNNSKMSSKFGRFASLVYLNLSATSFGGKVPSQVSHLSKLVSLDLSWNDGQTLDKQTLEGLVHNLTEVRQLFLDGINMSSINPNVFMNLSSSLRSLSSNGCDLRGKFPKNIFYYPNLKLLDLGYNQVLSLNFSEFNRSNNLEDLDLSFLSFSAELIDSIDNLRSLKYLDLSGTSFFKGLPVSITNLSSLERLVISDANIFRGLPDSMGNLVSLKYLDLRDSNLSGSIPRSLWNLLQLNYLDLSANHLSGQLPSSLANLTKLEKLYFWSNQLEGSIPRSLGNLLQLNCLDLSGNHLSGQLPSSLANLTKLEKLYFSSNQLEGSIPRSLGNLLQLNYLDLSGNHLSGQLPSSLANLTKLEILDFGSNQLEGSIPRSLGNLLQLNYLDLSGNHLSGQLPSSLTNLTKLENLCIWGNQLEGFIPDEVTAFPNLFYLDLSYNFLNGTLPSWLYTVSSLKLVDLSQNQFSGHIKEFQSKSLDYLSLKDNKLQGPIPFTIFQLANLTDLCLSSNNLNVVDFGMFSKLQNLGVLDLSHIDLSLNFNNVALANYAVPKLYHLDLSSCNLIEFPQFLRGSSSLAILDLSNNKISGKIPKWMWDVGKDSLYYLNLSHNSLTKVKQLPWKNMAVLDLSSNLFRGNLPIPLWRTEVFSISNNSFRGEVSFLICNASDLQILDLSHNNLSGIIPQCFGNLSKSIFFLNLQKNKFHGIIPSTFAKRCQLSYLNINGNQFEGPLTRSIINCKGLEVLDLGNNRINDTFPHWLGSLPQLQALVLHSNRFHGSIHGTRSDLSFPKIQIFDLSSNYFTGPLPVRYIKSFKAMINLTINESVMPYMGVNTFSSFYSYSIEIAIKGSEMELAKIFTMWVTIDLSNNKFEGEIPKIIGRLNSLKGLNLSHNDLSGCIPTSIGNLTSLEWLDLSSNKLVGKIPEQLLDLTYLSFLNLSKNELVACIPRGKQFNTFENTSYGGNKGLRGFPFSRDCSNNEPPQLPPSNILEEDNSKSAIAFGWKVVVIGYGYGVMFGMAMGYVVFRTGKPKWVVALVEGLHHRRRKRSSIGNRSGVGRRIQ